MLKVGVVFTPERTLSPEELKKDPHGQIQSVNTSRAIKEALQSKGYEVTMIEASHTLISDIQQAKPLDVLFNIATGLDLKQQQANIVAMLELQDIPFVGSSLSAQILALHKGQAKNTFAAIGVPVTPFQVFITGKESLNPNLKFPLIVKPEREGSSLGIDANSVVHNKEDLHKQIQVTRKEFNQPVLVEEYVGGREFTIGILGNKNPIVLPIMEIKFHEGRDKMQTVEVKADNAMDHICPADLTQQQVAYMSEKSLLAYQALGCSEFARLDARMDEEENIYFIELNTLPGLEPGYSNFPIMAQAAGYSLADVCEILINETLNI